MASQKVVVEIPAEKHVKSYFEFFYGKTIVFPERDPFGDIFYLLLHKPGNRRDKEVKTYRSSIRVEISEDVLFRNGYAMSPTNVQKFNNLVSRLIKNEVMRSIMLLRAGAKMKPSESFNLYFEVFNIPQEALSYEMIKKSEYRLRKKRLSTNKNIKTN
jgi:hypothetical protein